MGSASVPTGVVAVHALTLLVALAAALPALGVPDASPPAELDERGLVDAALVDRLSLPTEADEAAWVTPGLGVQIGYARGALAGLDGAPAFTTNAFHLRTRLRLDPSWSAALALEYAGASGALDGLRWSALLESVFHPTAWSGLAFGVGYGGLQGTRVANGIPVAVPGWGEDELASRDLRPGESVPACTGGALVTGLRAEAQIPFGTLFATGPFAQVDLQATRCEAAFGGTDRETGLPLVATRWWTHGGARIGWWLSWR